MTHKTTRVNDVDQYVARYPKGVQKLLKQFRGAIFKAAPRAEETISYQMPAYKLHGMLVYFAAYEKHIGFYPMPDAITAFRKDLSAYKTSKGAIQFPIDEPLPVQLISRIIAFRVEENMEKEKLKAEAKKNKPARVARRK